MSNKVECTCNMTYDPATNTWSHHSRCATQQWQPGYKNTQTGQKELKLRDIPIKLDPTAPKDQLRLVNLSVPSPAERFGAHVIEGALDPERRLIQLAGDQQNQIAPASDPERRVLKTREQIERELALIPPSTLRLNSEHPEGKQTNPKDLIGSDKVPMHLFPSTAIVAGAIALLDGMLKYGRTNWRETGVRYSIYADALDRHMKKAFEGEDIDTDSGLPHLWHALACIVILIDAGAAGKLNDDRQYPGGFNAFLAEASPHVKRLKEKYKDHHPKHWTIADTIRSEEAV